MKGPTILLCIVAISSLVFVEAKKSTRNDEASRLKNLYRTPSQMPRPSRFGNYDAVTNTFIKRKYVRPGMTHNSRDGNTKLRDYNQWTGHVIDKSYNRRSTKNINSRHDDAVVGGADADALKTYYNVFDGQNVNFGYRIDDPGTSNRQARYEKGNNKDEISGSYSIQEPDGSMRIVYYVADWLNGFRATVADKDGMRKYGGISKKLQRRVKTIDQEIK